MNTRAAIAVLLILLAVVGVYLARDRIVPLFFAPDPLPDEVERGVSAPAEEADDAVQEQRASVRVIARDLSIPWEIVFLPDGEMLVTERPGRVAVVRDGVVVRRLSVAHVHHSGEGGLLGMALHPDFIENRILYLYRTVQRGGVVQNEVVQYRYTADGVLEDETIILGDIPGARFHNGGRIAFGPDGLLYITTGDAQNPQLAQDTSSRAGKILRIHDDGSVPDDNPFGNEVFSYGHRNPQGLTWDDAGQLWSVEHGPTARDELNRIERGANYGWPVITGYEEQEGMHAPVLSSSTTHTWAPAGALWWDGSVFFVGLRGQALYEAVIENDARPRLRAHFEQEYGRLRVVVLGPDGMVYLATSNRDGRGTPHADDDRVIRVRPDIFR